MTKALIIGASGGIGSAIQTALSQQGVTTTGISRSGDGLDITNETSVKAALQPLEGDFDLIMVATGALTAGGFEPEKSIKALTADAMRTQFDVNTIGPAMCLKHGLGLLAKDRPAVFAVLSARVGSIGDNGIGGWYSYRAAKAAVNQIVHTAAIEANRTHKQAAIVALHPGTVQTPFTEKYVGRHKSVPANEAAQNLIRVMAGLGPSQTGKFFDWSGAEVPW
ncbi:SDR family NAD(P)-dependent oxidoreductase [Nereida sp. MMG025]|uniref:SDR family NAD(P)-dependent oxidoreductase n=1 Tax=Nereida sp. MMG025 TaxID=2909981 RepID=UPI001F44B58D|nr:SDR family NAD(P)-dependent oxidoreductase [Nereida sp. MMG025]MCF6444157.1 SDR family NAD(P)-dependent oxidoreductase [Nereida sp. MMG025]